MGLILSNSKTSALIIGLLICFGCTEEEPLTAEQLLQKTIAYHDPESKWSSINNRFKVRTTYPDGSERFSSIYLNLQQDVFNLKMERDSAIVEYSLDQDNCHFSLNGNEEITQVEKTKLNISCERAFMYRDYYSYLYGLPMKLKDNGTIIEDFIYKKTLNGKDYLVLKASYDISVGSDVWSFYINPDSYAMEAYQFYKTDSSGNIDRESGEYILLQGLEGISTIKMPKIRTWYYNKNDEFLGTDTLEK